MGETCGQAIDITRRSLEQGNVDVLSDVEKKEETINKMERDNENRCIQLLLLQQPVATDLRRVSSALKMVTDFERIGDHAYDIADILKHGNAKEFSDIHLVAQMAQDRRHGKELCGRFSSSESGGGQRGCGRG